MIAIDLVQPRLSPLINIHTIGKGPLLAHFSWGSKNIYVLFFGRFKLQTAPYAICLWNIFNTDIYYWGWNFKTKLCMYSNLPMPEQCMQLGKIPPDRKGILVLSFICWLACPFSNSLLHFFFQTKRNFYQKPYSTSSFFQMSKDYLSCSWL